MAFNKTATGRLAEEAPRDLKYFEYKFSAKIEDSRDYRQYVRSMPYASWDGKLPFETEVRVVPMKCIHLPVEKLEELIKEQDYLKYVEERSEHALKVLDMLRADERVRDSNSAVQKAYRNYITLLELARK